MKSSLLIILRPGCLAKHLRLCKVVQSKFAGQLKHMTSNVVWHHPWPDDNRKIFPTKNYDELHHNFFKKKQKNKLRACDNLFENSFIMLLRACENFFQFVVQLAKNFFQWNISGCHFRRVLKSENSVIHRKNSDTENTLSTGVSVSCP